MWTSVIPICWCLRESDMMSHLMSTVLGGNKHDKEHFTQNKSAPRWKKGQFQKNISKKLAKSFWCGKMMYKSLNEELLYIYI